MLIRIRARQVHQHLGLNRVRILKLVDKNCLVTPRKIGSHLRILTEQIRCSDEQVLKRYDACSPPFVVIELFCSVDYIDD